MKRIKMIGIDHSKATVAYRELFSFTKTGSVAAMERLRTYPGISGCIILSTCNRMEIWASTQDGFSVNLYDLLCEIKEVEGVQYQDFFISREGEEAVCHLFEMSCGLKSKILGEDQIISQVKDALTLAREVYCTDTVLEVLFRTAVTAGKKVKTQVQLSNKDISAIDGAVGALKKMGVDLREKTCMVIGNGEMGQLTALALKNEGANVTVTVRQYRSGQVRIPQGCSRINYGDRFLYLPECDLAVSATASPNYTLRNEEVKDLPLKDGLILIDLAVPRDIEPEIGDLPGVSLYDIDSFELDTENDQLKANIILAKDILETYIREFTTWYECRDLIPVIQETGENAARDLSLRIHKQVNHLDAPQEEKDKLSKAIDTAAVKVVTKLMYGLRDNLSIDAWRECVEAVSQIYKEEAR